MDDSSTGDSKNEEPADYDPELDIQSEQFNPLKALTAKTVFNLANESASVYNNLAQFESTLHRQQMNEAGPSTSKGKRNQPRPRAQNDASSGWLKDELTATARRFLPHQGLVQGKGKKARHTRNALLNIERLQDGPLGLLFKYKQAETRIKVHLRDDSNIIGYVTGNIEIYDKHWNMVLTNVHEVWKRRKLHYYSTADYGDEQYGVDQQQLQYCMERLRMLNIDMADTTVKSLNRKYAQCSRRLPQLMIRGEQIAIITIDSDGVDGKRKMGL